MSIATLDQFIAAARQRVPLTKTMSRTSVAAIPFSVFNLAGNPGAGTLAGTSTSTGVVPTDMTDGFPVLNAFGSGAKGYLGRIMAGSSVACTIRIYDMLWKGGAYAYNAAISGQSPASFASRVPGGNDFKGLELWLEQVTAATGIQSVAVTYNNQDGVSHTTPVQSQGTAGIIGRMTQIPLYAGDSGVQGVTGVAGSVATAGTFNILVLRPLAEIRIPVANMCDVQDLLKTGLPEVFADSALFFTVTSDGTSTGVPFVSMDIVNG